MKLRPHVSALALSVVLLVTACGRKEDSAESQSPAGSNASPSTSGSTAGQPASSSTATPASGQQIEITGNDAMKFSLGEIRSKPGQPLTVTLRNVGTMPKFSMGHNWVLLKKGADVEKFVAEAANAATTDYIPNSLQGDVLAHTKLLGPKESDSVTFNTPSEPGRYIFLCSFPGHYQVGMRGELIVE